MIFSSNHDQNTWLDSDINRLGARGSEAFAKLTFALPGMPLIYNGQEVSNKKKLEFFQRDPIAWNGPSRVALYKQWSDFIASTRRCTRVSTKPWKILLRPRC
jgi:glycosidase